MIASAVLVLIACSESRCLHRRSVVKAHVSGVPGGLIVAADHPGHDDRDHGKLSSQRRANERHMPASGAADPSPAGEAEVHTKSWFEFERRLIPAEPIFL